MFSLRFNEINNVNIFTEGNSCLFIHDNKMIMVNTRGSENTDELKHLILTAISVVSQSEQMTCTQTQKGINSEIVDDFSETIDSNFSDTITQKSQCTRDLSETIDHNLETNREFSQTIDPNEGAEVSQHALLPSESAHMTNTQSEQQSSIMNVIQFQNIVEDTCSDDMELTQEEMHQGKFHLYSLGNNKFAISGNRLCIIYIELIFKISTLL